MKRVVFVIATVILLVQTGFSQSDALQYSFTNFMLQTHSQFSKGKLADFTGMGGAGRYFSTQWTTGTATNPQDVMIGDPYYFNFDFKDHELYAQWKDTGIVVNSNYLKSFSLLENGVPHYFVRASSIHTKYFFESIGFDPELKDPKVQLLKLRTASIRKTNKNDYVAGFSGEYGDKMYNEIQYYVLKPDNSFVKVKLNRKSLSAALAPYKDKVEQFFANNELTEDNASELIRLINH